MFSKETASHSTTCIPKSKSTGYYLSFDNKNTQRVVGDLQWQLLQNDTKNVGAANNGLSGNIRVVVI